MASGECPKQWRLPPQLAGIRLVVSEEFDPRRTMRVPPASRRLPRLERGVCRMETHDIRSRGYSPRVRMPRPANLFTSPLTNQSEGETALRREDDRARNRRCDFCSASLKEGGCEREQAAPRYIYSVRHWFYRLASSTAGIRTRCMTMKGRLRFSLCCG